MPAAIEKLTTEQLQARVIELGQQIRQRRKVLGVSVITASQAAGMSRDTWHRMEKGEVTVTIGAWFNALAALGFEFGVGVSDERRSAHATGTIPVTISTADYPQLAALAWQLRDGTEMPARAAFDIYERNERHLDRDKLTPEEAALIDGLRKVFGGDGSV
ncbi:XRE family transcriptional regulator [Seongchinamella unica]|uniref:XRE family transcriptional regulator n=1 Tax=Seongchinamella unica TaxID=2547392 RepID=A0A4R5LQT0_9GAMM|nr:helix-turn-helix transcriptional regulator [Seongchinamella unica]TDG12889.1 XRE family transcriptional regulator [Seongchinamella unica]